MENKNPQDDIEVDRDKIGMTLAEDYAQNSEDPNTKVGACIMDHNFQIISKGCNCAPIEWQNIPWERDVDRLGVYNTKYSYVFHAEMNAIFNALLLSNEPLNGKIMYVTLFPCSNCAKLIVKSKIGMVIYKEYRECEDAKAAKRLLNECGVIVMSYDDLMNAKKYLAMRDKNNNKIKIKTKGE